MSYSKTSYVLALFTAIVVLSGSGFKAGPAQIRLFDLGIVLLLIAFVLSNTKLAFRRDYLFFYAIFSCLLTYSVLLLPVQTYSRTATVLQIIELAEYLVVFSVSSSFLINKNVTEHELVLDTVLWLTVAGSVISIAAFVALGVRPVTQWYAFGFPAFGMYYATAKYAIQRNWPYLVIILILMSRILVGQSRSMYLFVPLAALVTLTIDLRLSEILEIFSKKNILKLSAEAGILSTGLLLAFPQVQARVSSIVQLSQGFLARPARWLAGLSVFRRYPFGVGLGNYATAIQDFALSETISYPSWFVDLFGPNRITIELNKYQAGKAGPHSDFFRLLIELGFIGAGLLIIFWIFLFKKIINYSTGPISLALIATLVYLVFQQLVNSQLFAGVGGIFLVLILAVFSTYELAAGRERSSAL